jgi:hypothetical protein
MDKQRNGQFEYVTIIGNSFEEVVAESQAQRLVQRNFSITGPIARHQVAAAGKKILSDGNSGTFVSATFSRRG